MEVSSNLAQWLTSDLGLCLNSELQHQHGLRGSDMYALIIGILALAIASPILIHQVRAFRRDWAAYRLQKERLTQRPAAPPPPKPTPPADEVPDHLRRDIDHTLRRIEAEYNGRQIGMYLRAHRRLARMFPDQWAEILKEEKEWEERRDRGEDGT